MDQSRSDAIALGVSFDRLHVTLLGGFNVAIGPRVIAPTAWRLRKAGHLVKLLALAPQHRLHREEVLDTLWPHLDANAAGNNLRVTMHFVRKLLDLEPERDDQVIQTIGDLLALSPDRPVTIDVNQFETLAQVALRSDSPADYQAALDHYGGVLLPEDRFEEWAIIRREALTATHLTLLQHLARHYDDHDDPDRAIEILRLALVDDPTVEPVHVALMRLFARTSRRAQALRQYQHLRETLQRDLEIEPDPETTRLYEAILTGSATDSQRPAGLTLPTRHEPAPPRATLREPRTNLPAQLTSFVGREREREGIRRALTGSRFVTLTGPGGSGKTRLAVELAGELLESYGDGGWLVDLTALTDGILVPRTVSIALNVPEAEGRLPVDTLSDALAGKHLLLVLDNCEHLITSAADLVDHLLRACPQLTILATSREALRVPGEVIWPIPALTMPDPKQKSTIEELKRVDAVQLFVERARLHLPDFGVTPANAAAIAAVCVQLDGLPLAIELAAARIQSLPVTQLVARLDRALPLLTGGSRPGPERHRSLQATIAWSYDLLNEQEQRLLARLSVFTGGFTIEAAEAICADDLVPAGRVVELLFQLTDKSLVVVGEQNDEVRYRLLETIRQFAQDRLDANHERQQLLQRYRDWYRMLAERAEPELLGPGNFAWIQRLWAEIDNIRVVLDTGLRDDSLEHVLRVATALWPFWVQSTLLSEGRGWLEQLLSDHDIDTVPDALRARAMFGASVIAQRQGDFIQSTIWTQEALRLWRAFGDEMGMALAYNNLCTCAVMRNDYEETFAVCSESLARSQAVPLPIGIVASLGSLGEAELMQGNLVAGRAWLEQSLALAREINFLPFISWMQANLAEATRLAGEIEVSRAFALESLDVSRTIRDGLGIGRALRVLGQLALDAGDSETARTLLRESLEAVWAIGYKAEIARTFEILAGIGITRGNPAHATRMIAAAAALREAIDCRMAQIDRPSADAIRNAALLALGETEFASTWAAGQSLTLAQAIAEALADQPDHR